MTEQERQIKEIREWVHIRFPNNRMDAFIHSGNDVVKLIADYHNEQEGKKAICVYCNGTKKVNMMNQGEMPCVCTKVDNSPKTDNPK